MNIKTETETLAKVERLVEEAWAAVDKAGWAWQKVATEELMANHEKEYLEASDAAWVVLIKAQEELNNALGERRLLWQTLDRRDTNAMHEGANKRYGQKSKFEEDRASRK